jgi:hypothetical protein
MWKMLELVSDGDTVYPLKIKKPRFFNYQLNFVNHILL